MRFLSIVGIASLFPLLTFACAGKPTMPAGTTATTSTSATSTSSSSSTASTSSTGVGGAGGHAPSDILEELTSIAGATVTELSGAPADYRLFEIDLDQPANHDAAPNGPHFTQRAYLLHRDASRPMVLATTGYDLFPGVEGYVEEPAALLDANQLTIEHRFFSPSRPSPATWSDLDIRQAAADHHAFVTALKPIYAAHWISTGASKGGMTSVYHRRFFPNDVDGTVAYVAPQSYGETDQRYVAFLQTVGDAACRDALKAFQREALKRRQAMLDRTQAKATAQGRTFTHLTLDQVLDIGVIELPFTFWQYGAASCGSIPDASATDDAVFAFLEQVDSPLFWDDGGFEEFEPYFFQAATQLGYPGYQTDYLADLLAVPGLDVPETFLTPDKKTTFDPKAMNDVQNWVSTSGSTLLFVYGENDPYSAAAFEVGNAKDSYRFFAPNGNHGASIGALASADKATALAALGKWAGVPVNAPKPQPPRPRRGR
jgi:hypothetical protein